MHAVLFKILKRLGCGAVMLAVLVSMCILLPAALLALQS